MVFEFKPGSCVKADPQVAGEVCEKLAHTGGLTARRLLDVSRSEAAPLHSAFEWDDAVAAENYREGQAGHIIRSLVIKSEKPEAQSVRAFVNIKLDERDYKPLDVVLKSEDMTNAMLMNALEEMNRFQQKYKTLKELAPVFSAMNDLKKRPVAS